MSTTTPEASERDPVLQRLEQLERENAQLRAAQYGGPGHDPNEEGRPWSIAAENVSDEHTRAEAPRPYRGPGAVLHHFPILTGGSGGSQNGGYVRALAELLAELGYTHNEVIRGRVGYVENSLMADVRRFQIDHDVREHVGAFHGHSDPAEDVAKNLIGPYTVQALFEAEAEATGEDVRALIGRVEYEIRQHPAG